MNAVVIDKLYDWQEESYRVKAGQKLSVIAWVVDRGELQAVIQTSKGYVKRIPADLVRLTDAPDLVALIAELRRDAMQYTKERAGFEDALDVLEARL